MGKKWSFFLKNFWSDLADAIDILIVTDMANMFSLLKRCCKYLFCPQISSKTVNINFNVKQNANKSGGP